MAKDRLNPCQSVVGGQNTTTTRGKGGSAECWAPNAGSGARLGRHPGLQPCPSQAPFLCSPLPPSQQQRILKEKAFVSRGWLHLLRGLGAAKPWEWNGCLVLNSEGGHIAVFYIWIVNKNPAWATVSYRAFLSCKIRILNVCSEVLMQRSWCENETLPFKWSTLQIDEGSARGSAY